jgi:hypothetical protein
MEVMLVHFDQRYQPARYDWRIDYRFPTGQMWLRSYEQPYPT